MLSNKDILREIGRNILIYPFVKDNIKGASINLTASNMAWSIRTKESIYSATDDLITIPPHDTGLIESNEVLCVSKKIAGTYHSRVKNVSKGLGHIGTTLNPGWIGRSLIAVHNITEEPVAIKVNDPFVTICFEYLYSSSNIKENNDPGRTDVLHGFKLSDDEKKRIYEEDYNRDVRALKEKMLSSTEYQQYAATKPFLTKSIVKWLLFVAILVVFGVLLLTIKDTSAWYNIVGWTFTAYAAFIFVELGLTLRGKFKW